MAVSYTHLAAVTTGQQQSAKGKKEKAKVKVETPKQKLKRVELTAKQKGYPDSVVGLLGKNKETVDFVEDYEANKDVPAADNIGESYVAVSYTHLQISIRQGDRYNLRFAFEKTEVSVEYRLLDVYKRQVEIFLSKENAEPEYEPIDEADLKEDDVVIEHIQEDAKMEEKENEDGEKGMVAVEPAKEKVKIQKRTVSLSDIQPLWTKHPNECTDEDYLEFYRKVFLDYKEPLFWIHLNMDYPFNLKGILYFPRINTEYDSIEGTIKLYNLSLIHI